MHVIYSTEPVYRLAEQEWKDFVDEFTTLLTEVDPQVPPLPAKDIIHRIYRDVSDEVLVLDILCVLLHRLISRSGLVTTRPLIKPASLEVTRGAGERVSSQAVRPILTSVECALPIFS